MDVIQAQNIGEASDGSTANFIMDLIGYSPALLDVPDDTDDFINLQMQRPKCIMPSNTPKKRNRPSDNINDDIQIGVSKRHCNYNSAISASEFSDPKDLFLNAPSDKDREYGEGLFPIHRTKEGDTLETSSRPQPNLVSSDHKNNQDIEFIEMPDSLHTPNGPTSSNSFPQISQMHSGLSYNEKISLFNRLLDGLAEDSDSIIENGERITKYAESMKGILTKNKGKLELEMNCPCSSTHENGKACICSANTPNSVANSPMFSKFLELNGGAKDNAKINSKCAAVIKCDSFDAKRGRSDLIPRAQSLRPERQACSPLSPQDFKIHTQERKIKVPRREEKLLKQAIREILLPVDELAVLVSKRYENLKEDKPLCPMEPKTVELILRQYGYVICED
ncbi:hypothetical protein TWF694_007249 [Orbilia ellipsospora]|uniref:Uncharacterized protein n=1 Tax=Orbilia ellipsospora TaxID=2528407 RepID=A0AAV9XHN9_9PEZI